MVAQPQEPADGGKEEVAAGEGGRVSTLLYCRQCAESKPPELFVPSKNAKSGYSYRCLDCAAKAPKRGKGSKSARNVWLKRKFGITYAQYVEMLDAQGGRCAICRADRNCDKRNFSVDHCHKTEVVRGLLCNNCNVGLGLFHDDITRLASAIIYLKPKQP